MKAACNELKVCTREYFFGKGRGRRMCAKFSFRACPAISSAEFRSCIFRLWQLSIIGEVY
jgi:hypothetical protein